MSKVHLKAGKRGNLSDFPIQHLKSYLNEEIKESCWWRLLLFPDTAVVYDPLDVATNDKKKIAS